MDLYVQLMAGSMALDVRSYLHADVSSEELQGIQCSFCRSLSIIRRFRCDGNPVLHIILYRVITCTLVCISLDVVRFARADNDSAYVFAVHTLYNANIRYTLSRKVADLGENAMNL